MEVVLALLREEAIKDRKQLPGGDVIPNQKNGGFCGGGVKDPPPALSSDTRDISWLDRMATVARASTMNTFVAYRPSRVIGTMSPKPTVLMVEIAQYTAPASAHVPCVAASQPSGLPTRSSVATAAPITHTNTSSCRPAAHKNPASRVQLKVAAPSRDSRVLMAARRSAENPK